jgi:hypothetical protein
MNVLCCSPAVCVAAIMFSLVKVTSRLQGLFIDKVHALTLNS